LLLHPEQPAQVRHQVELIDQYGQRGADHVILVFSSPPSWDVLAPLAGS
jgi:hypothetical protein